MTERPPPQLVDSLLNGPSRIAGFDWHPVTTSTNALAVAAAARGVPEWHVVAADVQTTGRARAGRTWTAPPGSSLLMSIVLRPPVAIARLPLLPLMAGMAVAEVVEGHLAAEAGAEVAVKWPNDVLVRRSGAGADAAWGKIAGILVESPTPGVAVVGIGCNVDWREAACPPVQPGGLTPMSLAQLRGAPVDRWRVLPALLGLLGNRYDIWKDMPEAFLDGYRQRCVTIGRSVVVTRTGVPPLRGAAVGVAHDGTLEVRTDDGATVRVSSGDVMHVRPG